MGFDAQTFQMVVKWKFYKSSNIRIRKSKFVWDGMRVCPWGSVVSCKKLRDEGLHALKGMIGYCTKDNGEEYFEFVHHNVPIEDINDGEMEYVKSGKVGLNDRVSLSHIDILQRAHQWAQFPMKRYLGVTLVGTLFHTCKSMQFYHESDMGHSTEVPKHGCETCGVDREGHDESS